MISTELKTQIQGAYSRFLEAKSLKPRYGQRLMIAEIAKVLGAVTTDDEGRRLGEPAVVADFTAEHGEDPRGLEPTDPRWWRHQARYVSRFVRAAREMLA